MIEYFAGTGRISKLACKAGIACASFEIVHAAVPQKRSESKAHFSKRSPMDFNGECGFALLDASVDGLFVYFASVLHFF